MTAAPFSALQLEALRWARHRWGRPATESPIKFDGRPFMIELQSIGIVKSSVLTVRPVEAAAGPSERMVVVCADRFALHDIRGQKRMRMAMQHPLAVPAEENSAGVGWFACTLPADQ